jgi:hypothetical protein
VKDSPVTRASAQENGSRAPRSSTQEIPSIPTVSIIHAPYSPDQFQHDTVKAIARQKQTGTVANPAVSNLKTHPSSNDIQT